MTAILRFKSRKLLAQSVGLTAAFAALGVVFFAVFPAMQEEAELMEEAFPEYLTGLIGFEQIHLIEGFVGSYVYSFLWVLFVGLYFAYAGGGLIAADIRSRQMDLTLANPVSRESVLLQTFSALWVPLVVLNVGFGATTYVGALAVGESIAPGPLFMLHLLSVPFLLVCAAIGILLSVLLDREGSAQVTALGVVFMLWLVEGLSQIQSEYEWIGAVTPHRYYDPADILLHEEYAVLDATLLLAVAVAILSVATVAFVRRDI